MAEYWKSTPKYWCKFCKVYVRDTKFERQQHEATGRHQGSVQRSLRELHKTHDREEREKQRAENEVARLNGIVSGKSDGSSQDSRGKSSQSAPAPAPRQATAEERKRQIARLAEMGIAVPEEYRRDMAMAGDWETIAEAPAKPTIKEEGLKPGAVAVGVRKRKADDEAAEEEGIVPGKRKAWGSAFKSYPGSNGAEEDIEALLNSAPVRNAESQSLKPESPEIKDEETTMVKTEEVPVKSEHSEESKLVEAPVDVASNSQARVKSEDATSNDTPSTGVVFKKRKHKSARQVV